MAAVRNSDSLHCPFYFSLESCKSLGIVPLRDVNARWTAWRLPDSFYPEMIPEPDYSQSSEDEVDEEERLRDVGEENENEEDMRKRMSRSCSSIVKPRNRHARKSQSVEESLIKPKKPANPFIDSEELQKLHKELKFNHKYGKNGTNPRTELQEALQRFTENKTRKSLAESRRTSLEKILERQARKIEKLEKEGGNDRLQWIERLQKQHIGTKTDTKTDEFYRVHAKVVRNSVMLDRDSPKISSSKSDSEV